MIEIGSNIPYDFVTSVLHNTPSTSHQDRRFSRTELSQNMTKIEPIQKEQNIKEDTKKCKNPPKPRIKREKLFTTPDKLSNFLNHDSNKLIHLEPVPIFNDKSEIKPWLQKIFFPQGIDLVIERSDKSKIIFKCKAVTRPTNELDTNNIENNDTTTTENRRTPIITTNCPFRIRASYSLKLKKWNIVIVNNTHSHQCVFNPDSDEYKKFKNHLIAQNDTDTIKEFEELEYKTKFKLPILPKVISCDCGLTSEVNWFDVVIPEPKISGTKKVTKKTNINNGNSVATTAANTCNNSSTTLNNMNGNMKYDSISNFLDLNNPNINIINSKTVTPPGNITNLDEIDFTNMFATKKSVPQFKKQTTTKPSLKQQQTASLDEFNFNKIITTPSNDNLLNYSIDFNPLSQDFTDQDLNMILNSSDNGIDAFTENGPESTTATTLDTLMEPTDLSYMDFVTKDDLNLNLNYGMDVTPKDHQSQLKTLPNDPNNQFMFDSLM
ncbi:similar to Saccharomyces cerevisiae YGL071W AFT1 Transcription factor involved in iron utilization and homeostasis [Maudiozyma saulgeensis]|uniref:Similar to Saccharomyces cerevisiae YGL071W AFT1 Transcription factor involved in iron utilization and homeostasis n=1 Tax=Maudiozyma saulgeensis TaxID=1789683 RepID=A0A1X7R763_9SACH|nr:similar to Saccharomyces cerevisiae YGL071W AFT1 Transcription factor involved in iron utilization and homeostasis [Kazachstania saulgeensis]